MDAYGLDSGIDFLEQLLDLNSAIAQYEEMGKDVRGPGISRISRIFSKIISDDCVEFDEKFK